MKIALVSDIPQERPFSGPQRTTKGLAEGLESNGADVTVIGYRGDPSTINCNTKIFSNKINSFNLSLLKFQRDTLKWISHQDFDIVHTWEPLVPQPFVDEIVDVFSVHGVAFLEEAALEPTVSERVAAAVHTLQAAITARNSYTIAQSSKTREEAERCGLSVDTVIPVGIAKRFLQQDTATQNSLLYVSRINKHKNQKELAEVSHKYGFDLRLVGPIDNDDYVESIPRFSEYYLGKVSEKKLLQEYADAAVYVLPSKHEGFGLTALEAMAAGTPVVVSDKCGIQDIIEKGSNGYVYEQGNKQKLAEYIHKCIDNRSKLSEGARTTAERLTWDKTAERYRSVYSRQ